MTNTDSGRDRQSSIFTEMTELSAIKTKLTEGWNDPALGNKHCDYLAIINLIAHTQASTITSRLQLIAIN